MTSFQVIKVLWFWEVRTSTEGRKEREKEDSHSFRVHLDTWEGSLSIHMLTLGSWRITALGLAQGHR